jgi:glycosyltransferase involved in cell wall biosynthesis
MIVCSEYPDPASNPLWDFRIFKGEVEKTGENEPGIIRVPSMPLPLYLSKEDRLASFSGWPWVSKKIEEFGPDILHIHTEFVVAEFGLSYAKRHYIPIIYTFHTLWEDYGSSYFPMVPQYLLRFFIRRFHKNILRRSDLIICPTTQIRDVVRRYRIRKETPLLPTGLDPALFQHGKAEIERHRSAMEEKYPLLKGKRILLFAGRITKEKNIDFLLKILPAVLKKHPDVVLLIAGNGNDLEFYEEMREKYNLTRHCVFTGYLARGDLALTYAVSEIFVFPSLTETQGLVTIEAMLSGVPVVAIGEMGTIEVMGGDNGGFMVKNDPEEFTARVFDLLENKDLYNQKAAEAKAHAQSWTIDAMTGKLEIIYRGVLELWPKKPASVKR